MKRAAVCAALAFVLQVAARAQPHDQPQASFKAGVDLVRLDIQVTDADGRPIRDLEQGDVEVIEGGAKRPVVFFQHIEEPDESYADVKARTVGSEVSTNQGAARGHLYVLVFDQKHILPGHEQRARQAAQRFLDQHLRPGDRAAAYALPGPGVEIGFTSDRHRLAAALSEVRGLADAQQRTPMGSMSLQEAFQITRGDELTLRAVTDRLRQSSPDVDIAGRMRGEDSDSQFKAAVRESARAITTQADGESRRVLSMLVELLRPMRDIEGRKTVLLFSEGFNGDALQRDIDEVAAAAARAYAAIDAIDLSARVGGDATLEEPTTTDPSIGIHDAMAPLGTLAAETSGRLVLDANGRLDAVLDAVANRSLDYYLVGFTPSETSAKSSGHYRPVSVRVKRSGAQVSARTGFALDDGTPKATRRTAIDRALTAPFPQQALPVRYTTYELRGTTAGMQRIVLSLDADLPIASSKQPRPADVVFVVKSAADGRVAASGTDIIRLPEHAEAGATTGVGRYHVQFELPAGEYIMRAVVREPDGLVGSADRRLVVRPLDAPTVTGADLVLASPDRELPVEAIAYSGDGLAGMMDLYARQPDQLAGVLVRFELVAAGDETPMITADADLDEARALTTGAGRTARFEIPLNGVAPGTYLARATARRGADTLAESIREVEIKAGSRPVNRAAAIEAIDSFDPKEIATAAFAREYVGGLVQHGSPALASARRGLDRFSAGDFPAAIAAFETALAADDRNGATAFFLGWAFHGAGDDREAISAWRRAAFVDPTLVPVHLALADMYVRLAQPALAVQALRAGLAALPNSIELRDRLAKLDASPKQ